MKGRFEGELSVVSMAICPDVRNRHGYSLVRAFYFVYPCGNKPTADFLKRTFRGKDGTDETI